MSMFGNVPGMPTSIHRGADSSSTDADSILKQPPLLRGPSHASPQHPGEGPSPYAALDPGVFNNHVVKIRRANPGTIPNLHAKRPNFGFITRPGLHYGKDGNADRPEPIKEGGYAATKALVTELYSRVETGFDAIHAITGAEPLVPKMLKKEDRHKTYKFTAYPKTSSNKVEYPPHLDSVPKQDSDSLYSIFDTMGLIDTLAIMETSIPFRFIDWPESLNPWSSQTSEDLLDAYVEKNKTGFMKHDQTDVKEMGPGLLNIGYLNDWFSDRRFAEQSLTGTNPTTLTKISAELLQEFIQAAQDGGYTEWAERLQSLDADSLFVQDTKYFREAVGAAADAELKHEMSEILYSDTNYGCAAVTLYQLHDDGKLHPAAIVCDYKKTMKESVTIFNKRLDPVDVNADQATIDRAVAEESVDYPWRYAKTCAQVSDWTRHEIGVHLTHSHFIEEVIIVASKRNFDNNHAVYKVLSPHWVRTLSLNAAARISLVPGIVQDIAGFDLESVYTFIRHEFDTFDFVGSYVPNDLDRRGFPNTDEGLKDPKYKNYAYAKDMILMWNVLRKFVSSSLSLTFKDDADVAKDEDIQTWCKEIQEDGFIPSFPTIKTLDHLIDACTMCIHIAAPFHTAVNYLQNFYQAFIFAKPPAMCTPLPKSLDELKAIGKKEFAESLHIKRHRQWLLAEQLPWLLSYQVEKAQNLVTFAESHQLMAGASDEDKLMSEIVAELDNDLKELTKRFREISHGMDVNSIPYTVLEPSNTAVSILI